MSAPTHRARGTAVHDEEEHHGRPWTRDRGGRGARAGAAGSGIVHVTARFGYMETPDVPGTLALIDPAETEGPLHLDQASYFLSTIELRRGEAPTMAPWRKRLFIATSHITADAAEHFGLPRDRTVIMGWHIEV
ncbi:hypothetical protein OG601_02645 [Streptomyces sp. NBC_01239]|uniref:KUP/HAK/KT family potassium transporter n=1 Tax=Streptomyces sp. NBC_01239 TaxID=2903792 RepID=UPI0022567387|nr:hypothetical protein [Streptomyces sp. NBC_01239]MCX4809522.1 hypothetical protein [Streptomyces sp. NBC_01239]